MSTPSISDYLTYANLQMASEAFLWDPVAKQIKTGQDLIDALIEGNDHASKFTPTQAAIFTDPVNGWTALDQSASTSTGFSGTLFKNNKTGELVISFRSTEFIDDAARDNQATNKMEIANDGWAFGQIADMQTWYKSLQESGKLPSDAQLSVTGYSLGGHLATAFNLLYPNAAQQVVTFNGAGVGLVTQGTSSTVMSYFNSLRKSPANVDAAITDSALRGVIDGFRES